MFGKLFFGCKLKFSFWDVLRFGFLKRIRYWLDPFNNETYSHLGEDRILTTLLGRSEACFYVDVGCNDPIAHSNTFYFYKQGWRGICVDANERLIEKFKKKRPLDICVCAAVSNQEKEIVFYEMSSSTDSTIDPKFAEWHEANKDKIINRVSVRTQTLNSILKSHNAPARFDFLNIDVEGHDFQVLKSIDLSEFRPRIIVMEMHGFKIQGNVEHPVVEYLKQHDYGLIGYAILNGYFVDERNPIKSLLGKTCMSTDMGSINQGE